MNRIRTCATTAAAVFLVVASCATARGENAVRTWTTINGETIEASFVKLESGIVHLKTVDGAAKTVALTSLCEEDRKLVRELTAPPKLGEHKPGGKDPDTLSDDEIKALKARWTDDKSGRKYLFRASFGVDTKARRSGERVPVQITAALYELRGEGWVRTGGKCRFYILDEEGKVVDGGSESLEKMAAAQGPTRGGYLCQVPKAGKYVAVVWTEGPGKSGNFGGKLEADVR